MDAAKQKKPITGPAIKEALMYGHGNLYGYSRSLIDGDDIIIEGYEITEEIKKDFDYVNTPKHLIFRNCVFHEPVEFNNFTKTKSLLFENCTFKKFVSINYFNIPVAFKYHCFFEDEVFLFGQGCPEFEISVAQLKKMISISGVFDNKVLLQDINAGLVSSGSFHIRSGRINYLTIINCNVHLIKLYEKVNLVWESVFENVSVLECNINQIQLDHLLHIKSSNIKKLFLDNIDGKHRFFKLTNQSVIENAVIPFHQFDNTDIEDCTIEYLELWGNNNAGSNFNVQKTTFDCLFFNKAINESKITLRELKITEKGKLIIRSSDLGKTDFILCNFSQAVFEFENSKMTEIFIAESDFPATVFEDNKPNYAQAQLAFGQLNTAAQKQGDTIRALEFQSREIEAHYKHIHLFKKPFFINLTKVNLCLNRWSNDFGRSWSLGIIFSIIIGLAFFYGLVLSSKEYHFGFPITYDPKLFAAFLKFMNPLRFLDTENLFRMNDKSSILTLTPRSYLFDFLGRIFVAYGFYQTIQAFRRFGRK